LQHEITEKHNVFEENGEVMCAGWARTPVFEYNSEQSKTSGKHSERDCYFISNTEVSLYLSVENLGMEFAVKIAVADLKRGGVIYDCVVKKFVFSKNELPESGSSGELLYTDKRLQLQLTNTPNGRFLKCDFIDFGGIKNLREPEAFRSWMFRILSARCKRQVAQIVARKKEIDLDSYYETAEEAAPETATRRAELSEALGTLSPEERQIVLLSVLEGYTTREIASMLEMPQGTVSSKLSRSLKKLRLQLQDTDGKEAAR